MANLTVTSTGNTWDVDFGVYASLPNINSLKRSNHIRNICLVNLSDSLEYIEVNVQNAGDLTKWSVTYDALSTDYLIVDSIDGVVPTDQEHLYNLINGLRG